MIRRLAIFALLGPPLALLTLLLALFAGGASPSGHTAGEFVEIVWWTYRIGIVPAILAGLVDHVFAGGLPRLYRAAVVGFVACILAALTAMVVFMAVEPLLSAAGLLGIIPGIVCSWLAGRRNEAVALPPDSERRGMG